MSELVSVIMTVYNETESELREAVESILNQTYDNIELIAILDNPENEFLYNILLEYFEKDSRIKIIKNEKNLGSRKSKNKGIDQANGKYIAILDSDDIAISYRIEKQVTYLKDNEYDMVYSDVLRIDTEGHLLDFRLSKICVREDKIGKILSHINIIGHSSVMLKKEVCLELGKYRNFPAEDYDLWLRLVSSGKRIKHIEEPLIYYRVRPDSEMHGDLMATYLGFLYAKRLYRERKGGKADSFSGDNLKKFFEKRGYYNSDIKNKFNIAFNLIDETFLDFKNKRISKIPIHLFQAVKSYPKSFMIFTHRLYSLMLIKIYNQKKEDYKIPIHLNR